jgi:hypothetical protein
MKRIRKFLQLSRPDKVLLIRTIFVLAVVTLGLRIFPWLKLQSLLLKLANRLSQFVPSRPLSAQRIAWAVQVAGRHVPNVTCLQRALAAQLLLAWGASPGTFQIGVARDEDGNLEAHAWVTSEDGIIIGGVHDQDRFVLLSPGKRQGV